MADVKPTGAKPTGAKPTGAKPTGAKPTGAKPTGVKPTGVKPTGAQPAVEANPGTAATPVPTPAPSATATPTPGATLPIGAPVTSTVQVGATSQKYFMRTDEERGKLPGLTYDPGDIFSEMPRHNIGMEQKSGAGINAHSKTGKLLGGSSSLGAFPIVWGLDWSVGSHFDTSEHVDLFDKTGSQDKVKQTLTSIGLKPKLNMSAPLLFDSINVENRVAGNIRFKAGDNSLLYGGIDNRFGIYLSDKLIGGGFYLKALTELDTKLNFTGDSIIGIMKASGSPDLRTDDILAANWWTTRVGLKWDDVAVVEKMEANAFYKRNLTHDPLNPYSAIDSTGASIMFGTSTGINVEYINTPSGGDTRVFVSQNVKFNDKAKMLLNFGVADLNNADKRSYFAGIGLNLLDVVLPLLGKIDVNVNLTAHWDNVQDARSPLPPSNWNSVQDWTGLHADPLKGAEQVTQSFRFTTPAIQVEAGNKIKIKLGTANANGVDGVAFKMTNGGTYLPDSADVEIAAVTVYDDTLPPDQRELKGIGDSAVGQKISDINKGLVSFELPTGTSGIKRYTVIVQLSTNTGSFQDPTLTTAECRVSIYITRE